MARLIDEPEVSRPPVPLVLVRRDRGLVGAIAVRLCLFCKEPITRCTMPACPADGWVHLRSQLHRCASGSTAAFYPPFYVRRAS